MAIRACVARVADLQFGVVTSAQLVALGVGRSTISRWKAEQRLLPLYRGTYAYGHDHLRPEGRLKAAELRGGDGARLCVAAAAHWLGTDASGLRALGRRGG